MSTDSIQRGIDYQARWFWLWAAKLLWQRSPVEKVWFEEGPRGLDDVGVLWFEPRLDGRGRRRHIERHQVKFQVTLDRPMRCDDLVDPAAIGAESVAFIERARDARRFDLDAGRTPELVFVTDRHVDHENVLWKSLYDAGKGTIDAEKLMAAKRGDLRKVRDSWQARAEVDDSEFQDLIESLRIEPARGTFRRLDDELDQALRLAGLEGIDATHRVRTYDDLARKLNGEKKNEFTADSLRGIVEEEGLVVAEPQPRPRRIGVRGFRLFAEDLGSETDAMADFVDDFDYRQISDPSLWESKVGPELLDLAKAAIKLNDGSTVEVKLPCSPSLAAAAGAALDPRVGLALAVEQGRPVGTGLWPVGQPGGTAELVRAEHGDPSEDAAVVLSIAREIGSPALGFIASRLETVGRTVVLTAPTPGQTAVADGVVAQAIADRVLAIIDELRAEGAKRVHLLPAAPNAILFMIGRGLRGRGPVTVYDYDLDRVREGTYEEGVTLPMTVKS